MGQEQRDLFDKQPPPWELDDQREACVAAVVFADAPFGPYDYEVPDALRVAVQPGVRVEVPLGRGNRKRVGYCTAVENQTHRQRALKPIVAVVDAQSLLSPSMLRLTQWMADYYLCPLGQVLDAVVPAGVRGQAGTREQVFLQRSHEGRRASDAAASCRPSRRRRCRSWRWPPQGMTPAELAAAARLHGRSDPGAAAQEARHGGSAAACSRSFLDRRHGGPRRPSDPESRSAGGAAGDPGAAAPAAARDDCRFTA